MASVLAISAAQGSIPDMATPFQPLASDVQGITVQDSGPFIPEEQPDVLARELEAFFAKH